MTFEDGGDADRFGKDCTLKILTDLRLIREVGRHLTGLENRVETRRG